MQPGWCQPVRQEFMENECEALPDVAYPGVRDNRSTLNTKTGYDDDDDQGQFTVTRIFRTNYSYECSCSDFRLYIHTDMNANIHRKPSYE